MNSKWENLSHLSRKILVRWMCAGGEFKKALVLKIDAHGIDTHKSRCVKCSHTVCHMRNRLSKTCNWLHLKCERRNSFSGFWRDHIDENGYRTCVGVRWCPGTLPLLNGFVERFLHVVCFPGIILIKWKIWRLEFVTENSIVVDGDNVNMIWAIPVSWGRVDIFHQNLRVVNTLVGLRADSSKVGARSSVEVLSYDLSTVIEELVSCRTWAVGVNLKWFVGGGRNKINWGAATNNRSARYALKLLSISLQKKSFISSIWQNQMCNNNILSSLSSSLLFKACRYSAETWEKPGSLVVFRVRPIAHAHRRKKSSTKRASEWGSMTMRKPRAWCGNGYFTEAAR